MLITLELRKVIRVKSRTIKAKVPEGVTLDSGGLRAGSSGLSSPLLTSTTQVDLRARRTVEGREEGVWTQFKNLSRMVGRRRTPRTPRPSPHDLVRRAAPSLCTKAPGAQRRFFGWCSTPQLSLNSTPPPFSGAPRHAVDILSPLAPVYLKLPN